MSVNPTIKLTEVCNFNCVYCEYRSFSFTQKKKRVIDPELAIEIAKQCIHFNAKESKETNFCWHGGEPLLYPTENFRLILDEISRIASSVGVSVSHSLQTNGYLIDSNWLDLISYFQIMVGVSLDGPEDINGMQREKDVISTVLKNIKLLKEIDCFSGVLTVLTENHKGREKDLFDFYLKNGITKVGFCKAFNFDLSHTISNETLTEFMIRFFDLYFDSKYPLNVREYNAYISKLLHKKHSNYCFTSSRKACGQFITFNPNGDLFFCDDSYNATNKIGNITDSNLSNLLTDELFIKKAQMIRNVINVSCHDCDLFCICGCGCYRNDIDNYSKNYFCPTYKALISHIKHRIEAVCRN